MKKYNTGIFIGKFYLFQKGHMLTLNKLLEQCNKIFLVIFYNEKVEQKLIEELNYNIKDRLRDIKYILRDYKNIEVVCYSQPNHLVFPKDYLKIKTDLFKKLNVSNIDIQIFGSDEEEMYKNYIYADRYILGENIYDDGKIIHASLIRKDYSKYKKYLFPIVRKRLDDKFGHQKFICISGKSGAGKTTLAKHLEENLKNSIFLDVDKLAHESHFNNAIKEKIINLVGSDILDNNNIDRKKLSQKIFNNEKLKSCVYDITWQYMNNKIIEKINLGYDYIILDWYNIIYKNYWDNATIKIIVERDYESRKECVIKRDIITPEYFELREKNGNNHENISYDYKVNISDSKEINNILSDCMYE